MTADRSWTFSLYRVTEAGLVLWCVDPEDVTAAWSPTYARRRTMPTPRAAELVAGLFPDRFDEPVQVHADHDCPGEHACGLRGTVNAPLFGRYR